jgi:hypothetical protein
LSPEVKRFNERSVDSLENIYAVVIALAIAQAVQSLLRDPIRGTLLDRGEIFTALPAFIAFLVTLVPFWHGMNRHLDRCYLEKKSAVVQGAILFDFTTFILEASLLFATAWSLRSGINSFIALGGLLLIDMIWGFISHLIHFPGRKSHVVRWSAINVVAIVVAFLIVTHAFQPKTVVLMVIAIVRSIVDYRLCWGFYFPDPVETGR